MYVRVGPPVRACVKEAGSQLIDLSSVHLHHRMDRVCRGCLASCLPACLPVGKVHSLHLSERELSRKGTQTAGGPSGCCLVCFIYGLFSIPLSEQSRFSRQAR